MPRIRNASPPACPGRRPARAGGGAPRRAAGPLGQADRLVARTQEEGSWRIVVSSPWVPTMGRVRCWKLQRRAAECSRATILFSGHRHVPTTMIYTPTRARTRVRRTAERAVRAVTLPASAVETTARAWTLASDALRCIRRVDRNRRCNATKPFDAVDRGQRSARIYRTVR
jgi:hypothetical protein